MAKATWVQTNFNGGEWSPLTYGRFDIAKYKNGLAECANYIPMQQGGLTRRPGTRYVATVKDSSYAPRLQKFEFSTTQAYILEIGNGYIRVYANDGQLLTGTVNPWVAPASGMYHVGDLVESSGTVYCCKADHVAATYPPPNATYWIPSSVAVEPWDPDASYSIGDRVSKSYGPHGSYTLYYCCKAATSPGDDVSDTAFWIHTSDGITTWAGAIPYEVGDLVSQGGTNYYCILEHGTSNAPPNTTYWYPLTGSIFEIPTPYSSDEVWNLNFTQSADTLYITHPSYAPRKLQRLGATKWQLNLLDFLDGPYQNLNITSTTLTPSGTSGTVTVTASAAVFAITDVGRLLRIKCGGVWIWGTITAFTSTTQVSWTIPAATGALAPYTATATANVSAGSVFSITVTDGGSGYGVTPPSVSIAGGGGTGAIAYATVQNGVVIAITVSVTGAGYAGTPTVTVAAPTAVVASTTTFWRLGLWGTVNGYPTCVAFHQDRLWFGGTPLFPGRFDASNSGDYENFAPSGIDGTITDASALSFTLNSSTLNPIVWMTSDEFGMLAGTSGGEWAVSPSSTQTALTPTNVNAKQLSNYGSANIMTLRVGKATLFIQRTGRKLRELFYQFTYNTFQALDISLVAEHLTKGGIKQMALQLAPQQIVWIARTDGTLVGMTYDKEQEVVGWHGHVLGGYSNIWNTINALVESVATIPAPNIQRDELWVVVNRYLNGQTTRTVEVMTKMWEDGDVLGNGVFLDSSAEYGSGTPTTTVSGLTWLAGQTVGVLTNGAVHPDCLVSEAGEITLSWEATVVQVGLKYTSRAKTLRVEAGGADGPSQGKMKRIHRAVVRFFQSVGLEMGSDYPGITAYPEPFRTSADAMDAPVALFDGDKRWAYEGTWTPEGQVYFQTSDPLPSNITMLMLQLDTQDNT